MQPERSFEDDRHLEGLPANLRSGDPSRGREAIRATIANTRVGENRTLTFTVKLEGLVEAQTAIAHSGCRGTGPIMGRTVRSITGRLWKVIGIG